MEPALSSPEGPLFFTPSLPDQWNGAILSGSQGYFYEGPIGSIAVQIFEDPKFTISYWALSFSKKTKLFWQEAPMLRIQYVLNGRLRYKGDNGKSIDLKTGMYNGVWSPGRETAAIVSKGRLELLQICIHPTIVQLALPHFPEQIPFPLETKVRWMEDNFKRKIQELLNCLYVNEMRWFFYEKEVRDHLISFLKPYSAHPVEDHTEEEIERVHKVDHKILNDLNRRHSSEGLARFAKMSEDRLLALYKKTFGVTMFERYRLAKLETARQYLVETNIQIKVIFKLAGYASLTGFINAFTKHFGISPREYRKKHGGFD